VRLITFEAADIVPCYSALLVSKVNPELDRLESFLENHYQLSFGLDQS
jgi:hypothetical protein